jgi:hypothetical protein
MAQLELLLFHDRAETPITGGRVVIATPYAPAWTSFDQAFEARYEAEAEAGRRTFAPSETDVYTCYRDNRLTFERFASLDGERLSSLEQIPTPPPI